MHSKDLTLIILCDLHVLDADDYLVGRHLLVLCWELLSWFPWFLLVPVLALALPVIHCQVWDKEDEMTPHLSLSAHANNGIVTSW